MLSNCLGTFKQLSHLKFSKSKEQSDRRNKMFNHRTNEYDPNEKEKNIELFSSWIDRRNYEKKHKNEPQQIAYNVLKGFGSPRAETIKSPLPTLQSTQVDLFLTQPHLQSYNESNENSKLNHI